MTNTSLLQRVKQLSELRQELADHLKAASDLKLALEGQIATEQTMLNQLEAGLDNDKITLAETIVRVRGQYVKGGDERGSVRQDAIRWFSGVDMPTKDLRLMYFATKSYDRWHGQRSDHSYGYGPSHGSVIFAIELADEFRRPEEWFTEEQQEAAIYYLVHLEAIQKAKADAKAIAA